MRRGLKLGQTARAAGLAGVMLYGLFGAGAPGWAASPTPLGQAVIAWSTYLRTGPGETYPAISELEHDTRVMLMGCNGRWCHISGGPGQGYVDRDALDLPRTLAPEPPANADCVIVGQADNRGPIPTRFCSASAARR